MHARYNPFSDFHPAVVVVYLVCAAGFAMAASQPVYAALSYAGAGACACCVRGIRAGLRQIGWTIPVVGVVAVANLLFVGRGAHALFSLFGRAFTAEALFFGVCTGIMLASVLLWMTTCLACIDSAAATEMLGGIAPTVALMVTQTMRLIPQLVSRGRTVEAVAQATPAIAPRTTRERAASHLRTSSVLMGWALEDSLVRADAMRARGYACGARRTAYRQSRVRKADAGLIGAMCALAAVNVPLVAIACSQYAFYPTPPQLVLWWGYIPFAALMLVPVVLSIRGWWLWRTL